MVFRMLDQSTPPWFYSGPERRKKPRPLTQKEQERYWDWWQDNRSLNAWSSERAQVILSLLQSLGLARPRILDSGCGTGWFTELLANHGEVTGIDLSSEHIRQASERAPHIRFIAGSIFDHPMTAESFDVVVSQQVIAHVDDQPRYVRETAEALRSGGYLILTTINKFVLDRLEGHQSHFACGHIENFLTMKELGRLLSPHFEVLRRRSILPMGSKGVLRLVNSQKLNQVLGKVISTPYVESLKDRAGLGYINIVLAAKKN
ncbi:MAG: class I SAM-dependent methyltransferase [Burkholderiales bacterium]